MGYIQIPKLITGGGGETSDVRDMPLEWQYFKTLKEDSRDQAYLMFKGNSNCFSLANITSANTTVTIYGGTNGTTPLYRFIYTSSVSNRKWYHWNSTNQQWVANTNQPSSTALVNAKFNYADLDNYPMPWGLTLDKLTGKPVVNDPHIGTTELFTVIVHRPNGIAISNFVSDSFNGGSGTGSVFSIPVVAYSGYARGIRNTTLNIDINDLEFVELVDGTQINNSQFYENKSIGKIVIPNTVTSLGNATFQNAIALKEIEFSSALNSLPDGLCEGCVSLKKVILKEGLTTLNYSTFQDCHNLTDITLPSTLTSIYGASFKNCYNLQSINIPENLAFIDSSLFENCKKLKKVVLPDDIDLGILSFSGCVSLESINVPEGAFQIPMYCFNNCISLKEITLPDSIELIEGSSFYDCHSLKKLEIPEYVYYIGADAFHSCGSILYYKINATTPPSLADPGAFDSCNSYMKIFIPWDYITDYQYDTNWSSDTNEIIYRQRGFGEFQQGDTLPTETSDYNYNLTWYENIDDIINTTASETPTAQPITEAPADGEYYCTFVEA